ncbi:MAG: SUMF1/EgtB/PvdO family nonheme iron enzyme, partial [Verrucomicrobiae bacterium]|nr:SUMF1/EgtB/PvdO family nonheme iron enzyme [Verrucomicrobiae bacterium]
MFRLPLIGWIALGVVGATASGQSAPGGFSFIPGGSFTMGRKSGDTDADAPPTTVTLSPFYLQQTETTKAQWDDVRTWAVNNGYTDLATGGGKAADHPVQSVSWWDVVKWCNARSEKEGLTPVYTVSGTVMRTGTTEPTVNWSADGYRLPTEAEWEK